MRRIFTFLLLTMFAGSLCVYGQTSTLIINENFQTWAPTEDEDPADCESGLLHEPENVRQMALTLEGGSTSIDVTLIKAGIAPTCDTKRFERDGTSSTEGVTVGYVSLSKTELETDTIGQFIFGPIHHIDSMRFGHSATGGNRGIRIYKSADGETWERATDDEFFDSDDSQAGDVNSVVIDEMDVYIKFTSGIKESDQTSQHSRLHNLEVWGIPGVIDAINTQKVESLNIHPLGDGLFRLDGEFTGVTVYNTLGAVVYSQSGNHQTIIDLSGIPGGIYFIQARDKSGQFYLKKIMKN